MDRERQKNREDGHQPPDQSSSIAPATGETVPDFFSTDEIFQRVAASANEEIKLPIRLLFLSGLAAGLSIGLSFLARASVTAAIPGEGSTLVGDLLYPVGFLFIILGRYQLFTENTLTPVTLVLARIASLPMLLRNWGPVLLANVLGAILIAYILSATGIFEPEAAQLAGSFAEHALTLPWWTLFFKGVIAGWLVAGMVWIIHAAQDTSTRFFIVFIIMYLVPSAGLYHCIVSVTEAFYLVFEGGTTTFDAIFNFFMPTFLGNTFGGVLLVALLNYGQTQASRTENHDDEAELSWREWLLGWHVLEPERKLK